MPTVRRGIDIEDRLGLLPVWPLENDFSLRPHRQRAADAAAAGSGTGVDLVDVADAGDP